MREAAIFNSWTNQYFGSDHFSETVDLVQSWSEWLVHELEWSMISNVLPQSYNLPSDELEKKCMHLWEVYGTFATFLKIENFVLYKGETLKLLLVAQR